MTIKEAIERSDMMRPNAVPYTDKLRWLMEFDGHMAEFMGLDPMPPIEREEESDTVLTMPYPHDDIYPLYLNAMINNAQEETQLYMNDMTVANAAIKEAQGWWRRNNMPPRKRYKGVYKC